MKRGRSALLLAICFISVFLTCFVSAGWREDVNNDGNVDLHDLVLVGKEGSSENCVEPDWCGGADVDRDSLVNENDLAMVAEVYGLRLVNQKDMSKYSDKEVFLISDKDWRDVLPLVPVTAWTGTEDWCKRGYGTPEDVCVYPTLVFHEESYSYEKKYRDLDLGNYEIINQEFGIFEDTLVFLSADGEDWVIVIQNLLDNSQEVYKDFSPNPQSFEIYGNRFAWFSNSYNPGTGERGIYVYDLDIGNKEMVSLVDEQEYVFGMDISENYLVWVDSTDVGGDEVNKVYLYDLESGSKKTIAETEFGRSQFYDVSTSGDYVVWGYWERAGDNNKYYLMIYNIVTEDLDEIEMFEYVDSPKVRNNKIVWTEYRNNQKGLYLYDLDSKDERMLASSDYAHIFDFDGENFVYFSRDDLENINVYNIESDEIGTITNIYNGDFWGFKISGERILFQNEVGMGLHLFDFLYSEEISVDAFDADSIIYFMQQYSPDKVTIVGNTIQELDDLLIAEPELGVGLEQDQIRRLNSDSYLDYWGGFEEVVYVEDNYELALLASTYASLINVPLIIEGTSNDLEGIFVNRNVVCVGDVVPAGDGCGESYNLESLKDKYFQETNTNKFILTNPEDLDLLSFDRYETDKNEKIYNLYSKDSLSASFLASAKKELILPVRSVDSEEVDEKLNLELDKYIDFPQIFNSKCSSKSACSENFFLMQTEYDSGENMIEFRFDIEENSDLMLNLRHKDSRRNIFLGEDKTFNLRIINRGFNVATDVRLDVEIVDSAGSVFYSESIDFGDIEALGEREFSSVFSPEKHGDFTFFAEVDSLLEDPLPNNNEIWFDFQVIYAEWIDSVFNFIDGNDEFVRRDVGVSYGDDWQGEEPEFYEVEGPTQISLVRNYPSNIVVGDYLPEEDLMSFLIFENSEVDLDMNGIVQDIIEERQVGDVLIHAIYTAEINWNSEKTHFYFMQEEPIFNIINQDNLQLYSCDEWDFDNEKCSVSWIVVESAEVQSDYGRLYIVAEDVDGEAFAIGEVSDAIVSRIEQGPNFLKPFLTPSSDESLPEIEGFEIYSNALLVNCDSDSEEVRFYINDELVVSSNLYCYDIENLVFFNGAGGIWSGYFDLIEFPQDELNLRIETEGELIFLDDSRLIELIYNSGPILECDVGSECAPQLVRKTQDSYVSDSESVFNFEGLSLDSDYYLSIDIFGKNTARASIYIDDTYLGDIEWINPYGSSGMNFKMDKEFIEEEIQVKIIPQDEPHSQERMVYSAEVSIEEEKILPYFLTIVSSPEAIPMSRLSTDEEDCTTRGWFGPYNLMIETDGRVYGSINNYEFINFPVGRITGITSSDVSSNIARSLFFHDLPKNKDALLVVKEDYQDEISEICNELEIDGGDCSKDEGVLELYARRHFWTDEVRNNFENEYFYSGHEEVETFREEIEDKYDDVFLNLFDDHGNSRTFDGMMDVSYLMDNQVYLDPSLVLGLACSTCLYSGGGDLFCMQGMRRGALAQQGAVDVSYWHQHFDNILDGVILEGETIGEAYLKARNEDYGIKHHNFCGGELDGDPYYVLLGDPTWRPKWW